MFDLEVFKVAVILEQLPDLNKKNCLSPVKSKAPMVNLWIVPWLLRASSSRNLMELFTTYL